MPSRLVFDSDIGPDRLCPSCNYRKTECRCTEETPEGDGTIRVRRELRKGKPTAVAFGVPLANNDRKALVKALKKRFGTGGTATADGFELQGDIRDALVEELRKRGFEAKAAGG